jgi:ADP-ribose diphosphatase
MSLKKWDKIDQKTIFENEHWTYNLDNFEIKGITSGEYHYVHSPGSTMVIPKLNDNTVLLVNQYRYLNQKESLEFPCGSIDLGLTPKLNAQKELREESGMNGDLTHIGEFSPYTGVSDEICSVFIATNLVESPLPSDITEDFELVKINIKELEKLIEKNIIWDGLTLSAWTIAKKHFNL